MSRLYAGLLNTGSRIGRKMLTGVLVAALLMCSLVNGTGTVLAATLKASNLKQLGEIFREKAMERNSNFTVTFNGSDAEWDRLFGDDLSFFYYDLIKMDDPSTSDDADYIVGNIDFSKSFMRSEGKQIYFTPSYFETLKQTQTVNEFSREILQYMGAASMSNYEKVKSIHNYVCALISYDDDVENSSSVYSAYMRQKGLCNSYALCMYKLLTEAGVPCHWIGGSAGTGRDAQGHAWNIVELGDQWYNLDATWDDTDDVLSYDYFLRGSEDFDLADPSQQHTMDSEYYSTEFLQDYPIADYAFEEGQNDVNTKAASTWKPTSTSSTNKKPTYSYKMSDVITGRISDPAKLWITRKKSGSIRLYIKDKTAKNRISKITCQITKGKKYIKVSNKGIKKDGTGYYSSIKVSGKKKGSAKVKVTVTLKNGLKKSYTTQIKVIS